MAIKIKALLKVLKNHSRSCGVHIYSGDRRCTCGRDQAIDELQVLLLMVGALQAGADIEKLKKGDS